MIGRLRQEEGFAAARLCEVLDVHRSRYYAWRRGSQSHRAREDEELKPLIREIFWEHRRRYGARRIAQELSSRNKCCDVGQGHRIKILAKQEIFEETGVPGGFFSLLLQTGFRSVTLQQRGDKATYEAHVLGSMTVADATAVFAKHDIHHPV